MQITNFEVCDRVNGGLYKQIKPPLVDKHAFPLTGFVCMSAHVTVKNKMQHNTVIQLYLNP